MMDQTHIGYTYWQQPPSNSMPNVVELKVPETSQMGVAIEDSISAWPDSTNKLVLHAIDPYFTETRYIDIFNRGRQPLQYTIAGSAPWIRWNSGNGQLEKEERISAYVDWKRVPKGATNGFIKIAQAKGPAVSIELPLSNLREAPRGKAHAFVESDGYVSIEAAHFTKKTDTSAAHWEVVDDLGRTLSSVTIFPANAASLKPPEESPRLDYEMYLSSTGALETTFILGPCLNFDPTRGVQMPVGFDNERPQILTIVPKGYVAGDGNRDWEESVKDSARKVKSKHLIGASGYHTLHVWMVDPGITIQKIIVDTGGVRPSYLGPHESYCK
jgi:hypothetical protein